MNKTNYLEMLPLSSIAKYPKSQPKDAVPFTGYPRVHHSISETSVEKDRIILVYDPLSSEPTVLEFMLEDILFVEEVPSAINEAGEGIPMIKLWVRRGAIGMILEPFEVDEPSKITGKVREVKERILEKRHQTSM
jgi:inorganic pyrophosphatase